jgi:hypothetical protein
VEGVAKILGDLVDDRVRVTHLGGAEWRKVAQEVAAPVLPQARIEALVERVALALFPDSLAAADQLGLINTSLSLCREMAQAELSAKHRTYFAAIDRPASAHVARAQEEKAVRTLYRAVYGEQPRADTLAADVALLETFRDETRSWSGAWQNLCATYLSGPRLLYGTFAP